MITENNFVWKLTLQNERLREKKWEHTVPSRGNLCHRSHLFFFVFFLVFKRGLEEKRDEQEIGWHPAKILDKTVRTFVISSYLSSWNNFVAFILLFSVFLLYQFQFSDHSLNFLKSVEIVKNSRHLKIKNTVS